MKNIFMLSCLIAVFSCFTPLLADDLVFDSFEEAEKAAQRRAEEYNRRMKEHVSKVNGAWEKQKEDLGEGANYDISKITETRKTEQTSENEQNTNLQNSVTDSINGLKQQMINTATSNTVGFAGASVAYAWSVEFKDGKYVLSDTYDEAFFVSGASGNSSELTTGPGNNKGGSGSDNANSNDNSNDYDVPDEYIDDEDDELDEDDEDTNDSEGPGNPEQKIASVPENGNNPNKKTELSSPDRVVELTIQHPTSFKEAVFTVTEGQQPQKLKLTDFQIPEDTRVKISAKANMDVPNTTLCMTIVDDEGESEPIDSASMKNYRHLFRIPSPDAYSVNIYVNENGKQPKKIMELCVPVEAVNFDTRTISH